MDKDFVLGVDIGGSHISTALVTVEKGHVIEESMCKKPVLSQQESSIILDQWMEAFTYSLSKTTATNLKGIGISMPGPFDYQEGISWMKGQNKYENLYGMNIREWLTDKIGEHYNVPIHFENDAVCFGLGESQVGSAAECDRVVAITLGTGLGATFLKDKEIQKEGKGVPPGGLLYNVPFQEGVAENYISTAWLISNYSFLSGKQVNNAKEIYELATNHNDALAGLVFQNFGKNIGECLGPWLRDFQAQCLIIGGNITKASTLFLPALQAVLKTYGLDITIQIAQETELSAITGAAALVPIGDQTAQKNFIQHPWRKTSQPLMPISINDIKTGEASYSIYPFTSIGNNKIHRGFDTLSSWMSTQKKVVIDGYVGVDYGAIQEQCKVYFEKLNKKVIWYSTANYEKPWNEIQKLTQPFAGEQGSVWGKKTSLSLENFYQLDPLRQLKGEDDGCLHILIGCGAALSGWEAPVVYIDLPKNELQYRMRAGTITNLGTPDLLAPAEMYKRFYFIDWVVLNNHRLAIKDRIMIVGDGQWKTDITWIFHDNLKEGLALISQDTIRVRPWFEAGAWGGQWLKNHINSLNKDEINYAWSFELIVPENGLVFESNTHLLEVSFDWLMEYNAKAVLGKDEERFGTEFPIRFDFLDTFQGGNLSIQCHPKLDYIQKEFGERITQDETYYILDCAAGAGVYLGFTEDIDPAAFKQVLERSAAENVPVPMEQYVQFLPAQKHDLFLIPNGTIHSAGRDNLVLEISATPYIFTFKMYDWLRLDLNGEPRPINIEHAFNNLDFERRGQKVQDELLSKPYTLSKGSNFEIIHLPTHPDHFYDVHRVEFLDDITIETFEQCHVLMLVEGESITVKTKEGVCRTFHYAETFIIPAAAHSYQLVNQGKGKAKVIKAFIK